LVYNTADANLISSELVAEDLGLEIQPLDNDAEDATESYRGQEIKVKGYVELVWRLEKREEKLYTTRFVVAAENNAPFDAVLGRKSTRKYGL